MSEADPINIKAVETIISLMERIDAKELSSEDFIASLYGTMLTAHMLGYNLEDFCTEAKTNGENLLELLYGKKTSICPNKDENGNCPLHNLHCTYPDCEKAG